MSSRSDALRFYLGWRDGCIAVQLNPSQEPVSKQSRQFRGKVLAFNISPKGDIEGVLVETASGTAQLNFPKHGAGGLAKTMSIGSTIDVSADPEPDEGDHPVFRASDETAEVSGTIMRLNYALHGEVNGCHLDDGTFIHLKPEHAKKHKLRVGDTVRAKGSRRTGADAAVLEAKSFEKVVDRSRNAARA